MINLHARRTTTNQEEYDAFMPWRHVIQWRPGERKRIKRAYHRRWRKQVRNVLHNTWSTIKNIPSVSDAAPID